MMNSATKQSNVIASSTCDEAIQSLARWIASLIGRRFAPTDGSQ
jgi:hypothetical protein